MKTLLFLCAVLCAAYGLENKGAALCNLCTAFVGGIETAVNDNEPNIEAYADRLCDQLTGGNAFLDPVCRTLVNTELPNIIKWIDNNESADTICTQLHLC